MKKYISEDKKAFIVVLYIMYNFSKFSDVDYFHGVTIRAIIGDKIKEYPYKLIKHGKVSGDKELTAWDFTSGNYKQCFDDTNVIFDYNDGTYTQIITQEDDYWAIFDYNTKTNLYITSCDGFIQIFDYKRNQYSLYNYETVEERKTKLNRNNYDKRRTNY